MHHNNPSLVNIEICYGKDDECICDTVYREEDARLIAAAPELFELLQAIIDSGEIPYCSSHPLVIAAEQLISKVTGE
jgi:hypothetical protein